jgi:methionyl-tRNA formyltransferase
VEEHVPGYAFATGMEFAAPAVDVLCAQGDPPALLIGYPPDLQHRSGYAPLAEASAKYDIPLLETADINDGQALAFVERLGLDLFVIAGWSQLIREPLLSACPLGAIGLHPTRLPYGRGRAPLPWTIIKGLTSSAVSLFFLKPGVDDGDIIDQVEFDVTRRDDVASIYRKVTSINIDLLAKYIPLALSGSITPTPQASGGSTWPKRRPSDGAIDWTRPAAAVYDWIRALGSPYPGAFTSHNGRHLWIHTADLIESGTGTEPGRVVGPVWSTSTGGVLVGCGDGMVIIREVQWEGGPRQDALALFESGELAVGDRLEAT